jgi:hypothetical protein
MTAGSARLNANVGQFGPRTGAPCLIEAESCQDERSGWAYMMSLMPWRMSHQLTG